VGVAGRGVVGAVDDSRARSEAIELRSIDTVFPSRGRTTCRWPFVRGHARNTKLSRTDEITFNQTENQRRKIVRKTGYVDRRAVTRQIILKWDFGSPIFVETQSMLCMSKKTEYALVALGHLVEQPGRVASAR